MAKETELVIYAKVTNPAGFEQAKQIIHQEQAQIRAPRGRIRVRMERKDANTNWSYTLTTKKNFAKDGVQACDEENVKINAQQYEMFKSVCDQYMAKTRYIFPMEILSFATGKLDSNLKDPGLVYEVDRFIKAGGGGYTEWVKIDVEIDKLNEILTGLGLANTTITELKLKLSSLPLGLQSAFVDDGSQGNKMRELVDQIYSSQFTCKLV